jgi:hypothetical protein
MTPCSAEAGPASPDRVRQLALWASCPPGLCRSGTNLGKAPYLCSREPTLYRAGEERLIGPGNPAPDTGVIQRQQRANCSRPEFREFRCDNGVRPPSNPLIVGSNRARALPPVVRGERGPAHLPRHHHRNRHPLLPAGRHPYPRRRVITPLGHVRICNDVRTFARSPPVEACRQRAPAQS